MQQLNNQKQENSQLPLPVTEVSINLIPQYRKDQIARAQHLKLIIKSEIGISLLLAILLIFIWGLNKTLDLDLNAVIASQNLENNQDKYVEIKEYQDNFSKVNINTALISKLRKDQLYWSRLFEKLSNNLTPGIEITDLGTNNYSVSMVGISDTRDSLIAFRDKLAKEDCFTDVNLPLSNLASQENIDFQIDLKIKENCLKNK